MIRKVWQSMSDDNGGWQRVPGNYFWSRTAAERECNGYGRPPDPKEHDAYVAEDGKVFILSSAVQVFGGIEDVERARALEKLTDREKKALGL